MLCKFALSAGSASVLSQIKEPPYYEQVGVQLKRVQLAYVRQSLWLMLTVSMPSCRRKTVKRIERVQNPKLWRRFVFGRKELRDEHGHEGDNESLLFHGTDKATLEAVINQGFDIRVANRGSLGQGKASDICFESSACQVEASIGWVQSHSRQLSLFGQPSRVCRCGGLTTNTVCACYGLRCKLGRTCCLQGPACYQESNEDIPGRMLT